MTLTKREQEDLVIKHIKDLLFSGELKPGDKLPAERKLADNLNVPRIQVRGALQKLEIYGIIDTFPQSGSVISNLKVQALDRTITDILQIDQFDFYSLVEVRVTLEKMAIRLCSQNRTQEDLDNIKAAMVDFENHIDCSPEERASKDVSFHQAIAHGSGNPVLASLLLVISPDIISHYRKYNAIREPYSLITDEHRAMFNSIKDGDADNAEKILLKHLNEQREFAYEENQDNYHLESAPQS